MATDVTDPDPKCTETAEQMLSNENQPTVTTLSVLVKKADSHMKFHAAEQVKFADWKRARLQRENNTSLYVHHIDEDPKLGGGSTYGRAARQEARNRRYTLKYKPENQPWILTTNSTDDKKRDKHMSFKGVREGGIGENSAYYIFVLNADGKSISAYPVKDWYKFLPTQRYKTLSLEEAEEKYMRRNQILNYFSLMTQKRLRSEEESEDAKLQTNAVITKSIKDFKISEMDEWISSDEEDDESDADNKESDNHKDKKKKKKANSKKKNVLDNEVFEESDDGDEEGRECEYITDSSVSESELEQQKEEGAKSVAEEIGLKNLLSSDSESSDEGNIHKDIDRPDKACGADKSVDLQSTGKENKSAGSNLLSVAEDTIGGKGEAKFQKRTMSVSSDEVQTKRFKSASALYESSYISGASESGISIETVSRYLKRKPITFVNLVKKFKTKKTGLNKEKIGHILILTLQKIKLNQQKIQGVTYYSL